MSRPEPPPQSDKHTYCRIKLVLIGFRGELMAAASPHQRFSASFTQPKPFADIAAAAATEYPVAPFECLFAVWII